MVAVTICKLVTCDGVNGSAVLLTNTVGIAWLRDLFVLTVTASLGIDEGRLLSWEAVNTWPEIIVVGCIPVSVVRMSLGELVLVNTGICDEIVFCTDAMSSFVVLD